VRVDVTIIVPGLRKYMWDEFYESVKKTLNRTFEVIIVSPHKTLTEKLKDVPNIKLITDYGSPARCQQIALCHAVGKYVTWCADDCVYFKDKLGEIVDFYEKNRKSYKDIAIFKYFEGECGSNGLKHTSGQTEMSTWDYYNLKNACPWLSDTHIPGSYWLLNSGILDTKYAKEIGGWDTQFETMFCAHTDFAIRTQNNNSTYLLFEDPIVNCSHTPGASGDHGPVHFAQLLHDEPLLKQIYWNKDSLKRIKIDLNNWENSPKIWARRFKRS
jgi:hypothetical protein